MHPSRCGLALLFAALAPAQDADRAFPEAQAAIDTLLFHYDRDMVHPMVPVWRDLAAALPTSVTIVLAAPDERDARGGEALLRDLGFDVHVIVPAVTGAPLTVWARDRLLVRSDGTTTVLWTPPRDAVAFDRRGDVRVAEFLGRRVEGYEWWPAGAVFEGGNVLFAGARAIAGGLFRDVDHGHDDQSAVRASAGLLGTDPVFVGTRLVPPHEHVDMYLSVLAPDRVLLGDPLAGARILDDLADVDVPDTALPDHDRWDREVQAEFAPLYGSIASELADAGFRVARIPILHGDSGSVLTWNNALVERREDGPRAYVPVYGVPRFDRIALATWRAQGFRVFPIDASRLAEHGGTVRCVTNVLRWREVPATTVPAVR